MRLVDIQEILVKREMVLKFDPSPNPYNPEDYPETDKKIKSQIQKDQRLNLVKRNLAIKQKGLCTLCNQPLI